MCVFVRVFKPLVELWEAHVGTELLEKDLYKDSAGRRGGLLAHPDTLQYLVNALKEASTEVLTGIDFMIVI